MSKSIDYNIFSLPENEVRIVWKYEESPSVIVIEIKGKVIKHRCPKCWWYNTKRIGKGYDIHMVNHIFISNYKTIKLKIYKRKWGCMDCDRWRNTFRERFSFIKDNCSYTETYKLYILWEREYSSLSELARKFKVSESMVYDVIRDVDIKKLTTAKIEYLSKLWEIYLWVDEVSFKKQNYICTITELKTKKVVWVLETRSKQVLEDWLSQVPTKTLKKIKWIATDMNATYKRTIQNHISKRVWKKVEELSARWVVDHYHIKQLFSKLIMEVYSMNKWMIKAGHYDGEIKNICDAETITANKYRTKKLPWTKVYHSENDSYRAITLWFFLSKRYSSILLRKATELTEKQYDRLRQIFTEFDPYGYLYQAWRGKETMNYAIIFKSIEKIDWLIQFFRKSIHYKIETTGKTLKKRRNEIKHFFTIWITNAFTEWKNTKAKLFKRMAYWYYIKENYIKRLLLCL